MQNDIRLKKNNSVVRWFVASCSVISLFWLLLCAGCNSKGVPVANMPAASLYDSTHTDSKVLSAGDVISISFSAANELSQSQKIRIDGKISLPMIGEVTAAGKSIKSFQSELSQLYQSELQNPEVVINLVTNAEVIYVIGEVMGPGKVFLDREMTAFEAIMESGGFSDLANLKKIILTRLEDGKFKEYELNFKDEERPAFYLKAYDTIKVSRRIF